MIKSFEDITGVTVKFKYLSRSEGDLLAFWADTSKAIKKISWHSERNIKNVCEDTWRWHQKNPIGYGKKK